MSETNPQLPSVTAPVLMPALVEGAFDYLVPEGTPEGALVEATLASRSLVGVVWGGVTAQKECSGVRSASRGETDAFLVAAGVSDNTGGKELPIKQKKDFTLKPVTRVLEGIPPLKPEFRAWIDWVSHFTLAPKGAVLSLCGLAHGAKTTRKKFSAPEFTIALPALTVGQQAVVDGMKLLQADALAGEPRSGRGKQRDLEQRVKDERASQRGVSPPSIKPILLDGVTGSGKTEVYFHRIAACLEKNQQVLVLLPEIALTHQWLERFEKTFGAAPVVWHSRMTPAAKARAWQAVARGEAPIVVGARSALFLPFANLQLIIVDEEHDPSYKQEEGVLYHARDMAVARAHFERIPIVLVSATPSLETMENAREGKYHAVQLPERFGAAGLPTVKLVDMRIDTPERGNFIAPSVKAAMLETLARGEQVLFFMNRRGYAPLLLCRACGHRFECPDCSAWLVVHGRSRLHCHHCNHREPLPNTCPACQATADKLAACGPGVERIAQEVSEMFVGMHSASAVVPPPLGGRLGGGPDEAQSVPQAAPPQPSPYGGGGERVAKTLPISHTVDFAKTLRTTMTDAEKKLWQGLRRESLGVKFRKQHPIGPYIADFACLEPKLIVELDGGQHNDDEAIDYDNKRTQFLEAQGFKVLRFWNNELLENSEGVLTNIVETIHAVRCSSSPTLHLGSREHPSIVTLSSDETIAAETWADIEAGKIDILVGTQMVAKGHHFPRLTLVVVVDADVGLDGADLRAGERSYQLLHQLGGRAGRGELQGQVLVQTYCPEHAVMKALVAHDRNRLMALEAKERKLGGWPPFGQLAAILLDGVDEAKVRAAGQMLARTAPVDPRIRILGPAPAPLSKLRGQYRYRCLL